MALLIGQQPTGRGFGRERRRNGIVGRSFHIFGNRKRITWIDTKGCNQLVYISMLNIDTWDLWVSRWEQTLHASKQEKAGVTNLTRVEVANLRMMSFFPLAIRFVIRQRATVQTQNIFILRPASVMIGRKSIKRKKKKLNWEFNNRS